MSGVAALIRALNVRSLPTTWLQQSHPGDRSVANGKFSRKIDLSRYPAARGGPRWAIRPLGLRHFTAWTDPPGSHRAGRSLRWATKPIWPWRNRPGLPGWERSSRSGRC